MRKGEREREREKEKEKEREKKKRRRGRRRGRERGRGRETGRGTAREREREKKRERKGKRKIKRTTFVKGVSFFSWLQDQLWKNSLQKWTLGTNLLKWTGPSHGPVPWKFVEKLFFNKGLISDLILFGKAWALNLAIAFVKGFSSLGSRISSGKIRCNCEPWEQNY